MSRVDELMGLVEELAMTAKRFGLVDGDVKKTIAHAVQVDNEVREQIESIRAALSACVAECEQLRAEQAELRKPPKQIDQDTLW